MTDNKDWKPMELADFSQEHLNMRGQAAPVWKEHIAWQKALERKPAPATLETLILQNDMLYGKMDRMHNTISELEKRVLELTEILKLKVE